MGIAMFRDVGGSMADSEVLFILSHCSDSGGSSGLFSDWVARGRGGVSVSLSLVSLLVLQDWSDFFYAWTTGDCGGDSALTSPVSSR